MMNRSTRRRTWKPDRRRGFTLTELMIAAAVSGLVIMAAASLQFVGARTSQEVFGQTRMRSARMQAIDQIRYRLSEARVGSCTISEEGRRIDFVDPNFGGAGSRFFFTEDQKTLFYDNDISDGTDAVAVTRGPINITFQAESGGALVRVRVKSASGLKYGDVDEQDGEVAVYLRNL